MTTTKLRGATAITVLMAFLTGCGGDEMNEAEARQIAESYINRATEAVPDTSFEVTEATDQCYGPLGGYDGTRHFTFSAVAEPPEEQIPAIVDAVRAAWSDGYELTVKDPEDRPAPSLFASAGKSQASLIIAYPKDGHGWQIKIDSSSPCYEP